MRKKKEDDEFKLEDYSVHDKIDSGSYGVVYKISKEGSSEMKAVK